MILKWTKRILVLVFSVVAVFSFTIALVAAKPEKQDFYPVETGEILNNPFMGWAPWANGGPYQQPHRLVYINATWAELEPEKGRYAFNTLEANNKFAYWRNRGVNIIFRLNMDYPGERQHMDIPKWLYDEIGGDGTRYDTPYGKGFSPNYANPKLISYHEKLINALAERYNTDSLIPFVAIGSLGHWGEFHTWKGRGFTIPFPPATISDQYVSHYIKAFTEKFLFMRRPFKIARDNGMGLYNDSFGDPEHTYDLFIDYIEKGYRDDLTGEVHPSMPGYWMQAPSGGEFARYPGLEFLRDYNLEQTLREVEDSHVSWLGPSSPAVQPPGTGLQENFNRVLNKMGYRFVLKSISHENFITPGNSLTVNMTWLNKGVAPFYYKWPLELSLSDASGKIVARSLTNDDIRTWLPGEIKTSYRLSIPESLKSGKYTLCVAFIDPATDKPGIDLPIEGRRPDGRYALNDINFIRLNIIDILLNLLK